MSDVIKAEDIPPQLVEHYLRSYVSTSWPEKIARDINAAIEAGLVSPPATKPDVMRYALKLAAEQVLQFSDALNGRIGQPVLDEHLESYVESCIEKARKELDATIPKNSNH